VLVGELGVLEGEFDGLGSGGAQGDDVAAAGDMREEAGEAVSERGGEGSGGALVEQRWERGDFLESFNEPWVIVAEEVGAEAADEVEGVDGPALASEGEVVLVCGGGGPIEVEGREELSASWEEVVLSGRGLGRGEGDGDEVGVWL
jgi:hypothetical protein